ncbi:hypothetical protein E6R18_04650 [Streptomyces sp. A1277]|uniref:hypothetical protein n=1 Tax=Streptomyces sp. A1277 TaxID=2563103 RepID=UPI0010A21B3E|nr:hypothetical protein [Streptomyces sp. A1277]THA35493.1 hypothetical protein E6R18_04650 [Streptomyces sp. A1277]
MTATDTNRLTSIGARPVPAFDGVREVRPRGDRLRAARRAAAVYQEKRFRPVVPRDVHGSIEYGTAEGGRR